MKPAGRLLGTLKIAAALENPESRLRAAWAKAAGPKVARHTRVASLVRETLLVEVEDFIWQKQLASLGHFIVSNLARDLGEVLVKDIDFRPMPRRMGMQRAESARADVQSADTASADDAERIEDPVMRMLYRQSRKRESA
jgi:hypothetical protein